MDSYLERLQLAITSATRGMKVEELGSRPPGYPAEKWSVAEILEHLYLTYTGTSKGFERCLQAGKPLVSPITLKQRARITVVTGLGYLPKRPKSARALRSKRHARRQGYGGDWFPDQGDG